MKSMSVVNFNRACTLTGSSLRRFYAAFFEDGEVLYAHKGQNFLRPNRKHTFAVARYAARNGRKFKMRPFTDIVFRSMRT